MLLCWSSTSRCLISFILLTCNSLTYTERLELLGLERRIRADILFAYKLLFGLTALHSDDFFILSESNVPEDTLINCFYRVVQLMSATIFSANVS